MKSLTVITAHSGCEDTQIDSMESLHVGIALGADIAEVDVRQGGDNKLVISHDRRNDYGGFLLLSEVFGVVAANGRIGINCDLKESDILEDVLNLASDTGVGSQLLALSGNVTPAALRANPDFAKRAQIYLNIEQVLCDLLGKSPFCRESDTDEGNCAWEFVGYRIKDMAYYLDEIVGMCKNLGVSALNLPCAPLTEPYLEKFIELGVPLSVWTINNRQAMKYLFKIGIKNLTTLKVRTALEERNNHQS